MNDLFESGTGKLNEVIERNNQKMSPKYNEYLQGTSKEGKSKTSKKSDIGKDD